MKTLDIGKDIELENLREVVIGEKKLQLSNDSLKKVSKSRKALKQLIKEDKKVYGVNTGVGALQDTEKLKEDTLENSEAGKKILRSHATCVGPPVNKQTVQGAMILLVHSLAQGYSGVRPELVNLLIQSINKDLYPYVPQKGSVGASGDLGPAAHIGLALMEEGEVVKNGRRTKSRKALKEHDLSPIEPDPREALAMINGTYLMTSLATFNLLQTANLLKTAEITTSLCYEALKADKSPLNLKINQLRPHSGKLKTVNNLRTILKKSQLLDTQKGKKLQDAYSLRCAPQVIGSARDAFVYSKQIVEEEINAVTDNPLILSKEKKAIFGGNFHGAPIAHSQEALGTAVASLGNLSERRIARLLDKKLSGLPSFLMEEVGENSGFMLSQYTAASLVAENKVYAHPANVDSIPTSANQEDFNNFGTISARKTRKIIKNVRKVLGIEAICATQAIDLINGKDKLGQGTKQAYTQIRKKIPFLQEDEYPLYKLFQRIEKLIKSKTLSNITESL